MEVFVVDRIDFANNYSNINRMNGTNFTGLNNTYYAPMIANMMLSRGELSKDDAMMSTAYPFSSPFLDSMVLSKKPLATDTVEFKGNDENSNELPKSSTNKRLVIGGILLSIGGLAALFLTRGKDSKDAVKTGKEIIKESASGNGKNVVNHVVEQTTSEAPEVSYGIRLRNRFDAISKKMPNKAGTIKLDNGTTIETLEPKSLINPGSDKFTHIVRDKNGVIRQKVRSFMHDGSLASFEWFDRSGKQINKYSAT